MQTKDSFWSSLVLGMHDALVSTLGLVVGLAFADATQYVIVLTGTIAAVTAGLSMMASEYLSQKAGGNARGATVRGLMTGAAYVATAGMLLIPFVFTPNTIIATMMTYVVAVAIIFFFNFLKSKLNAQNFWPAFIEMLAVCFLVTFAAFLIGEGAKVFFGVEI
ncbi:MAG: VIT1/CCC1 transporter family protein [Alphaproteobacteria bacterium]|nr:VIT1/CCC1 transporter family protein [Alphaproteobacteria bacterium]